MAQKEGVLVFVEVRTRRGSELGSPEESVTVAKKKRLEVVAQSYIQTHENLPPDWRIDVMAIELDRAGKVSRLELIENALA